MPTKPHRVLIDRVSLDDALQLWCLPRSALRALLKEPLFQPENLAELRRLATS